MNNKLLAMRPYVLYFFFYALFGWTYEVFLEVVIYKWGFSNRGFLFGPYTPIYGFGALIFILILMPKLRRTSYPKKFLYILPTFLACMVIATGLELVTSYLMEWTTGSWPWQTYVDYDYHFQGRIALSPSIRFGLGGTFFLYGLQPLFEAGVGKIKDQWLTKLSVVIIGLLSVDFLYTVFIR